MDRLKKCITSNGEDTDSAQTIIAKTWNLIRPVPRCPLRGGALRNIGGLFAANVKCLLDVGMAMADLADIIDSPINKEAFPI
jgi:hypothetical protein